MMATKRFETAFARGASLKDIAPDRIAWFVRKTEAERGFKFKGKTSIRDVLVKLNLIRGKHLLNAALLLFGRDPQRFCRAAVIKCVHYYGSEIEKPIPSYQVFGGSLFEQLEHATDFILAKLNRTVGARNLKPSAGIRHEIPAEAIAEIIVNAVAHRDYNSRASVQASVFADRVEVSNPGRLPDGLQISDLGKPHNSVPVNPFIARPLFLAGYIEQIGYGTLKVIKSCEIAHLPAPTFEQRGRQFTVILWRNRFTDEVLDSLGLSHRQKEGIARVKRIGWIANLEYRKITGATRKTASRDLDDLVEKGVLQRAGEKRGTRYFLSRKK
jgi:predicted HTH transcriptional regulator